MDVRLVRLLLASEPYREEWLEKVVSVFVGEEGALSLGLGGEPLASALTLERSRPPQLVDQKVNRDQSLTRLWK